MILYDIVKGHNYPIIECRYNLELPDGDIVDTLFGRCKYQNDVLQCLDNDFYTLSMEIDDYKYDKEKNILYVWQNTKALKGKDYDKYIERYKRVCENRKRKTKRRNYRNMF